MRTTRSYVVVGLLALGAHTGCAPTLPGTHVELIQEAGRTAYVSGAAAPGMSQGIACAGAVNRAVSALALRFSQEQHDLADIVAKAVDVRDGKMFLQQYAKDDAQRAAVQDVQFNPSEHLCMATVRWQPPLFVETAAVKYAEGLRDAANAPPKGAGAVPPAVPSIAAPMATPPAPQPLPPPPPPPPPPPVDVAPAPQPAVASAPAPPACPGARSAFEASLRGGDKALADYRECLRRTDNDSNVCYRYGLYVEDAKKNNAKAAQRWADCVDRDLPLRARETLQRDLPGQAGKVIESRADGGIVVWTYGPADGTAYTVEISPSSAITHRDALPANQVAWLRQQLGM